MSLACQEPEALGRLEARMTHALIVQEAAKQGTKISRSSVQRILAQAEVKPHRVRYYLFTTMDIPEHRERRDAICDLYTRKLPADEVIVCFDEKTGMQALGRPHPGLPAAPGRPRLVEHNYIRHGSRTLAAAVRPDTGQLVAGALFPSSKKGKEKGKRKKGYATPQAIGMLKMIGAALPEPEYSTIHLVWDNASTHTSKLMKAFLASPEGRRFRPYYTPTHASWLNLAENFFSRFSRRYHNGRRYESLAAFDAHIPACLEDYDRWARPFDWQYHPAEKAA